MQKSRKSARCNVLPAVAKGESLHWRSPSKSPLKFVVVDTTRITVDQPQSVDPNNYSVLLLTTSLRPLAPLLAGQVNEWWSRSDGGEAKVEMQVTLVANCISIARCNDIPIDRGYGRISLGICIRRIFRMEHLYWFFIHRSRLTR